MEQYTVNQLMQFAAMLKDFPSSQVMKTQEDYRHLVDDYAKLENAAALLADQNIALRNEVSEFLTERFRPKSIPQEDRDYTRLHQLYKDSEHQNVLLKQKYDKLRNWINEYNHNNLTRPIATEA